jgi:hypothetical protein
MNLRHVPIEEETEGESTPARVGLNIVSLLEVVDAKEVRGQIV